MTYPPFDLEKALAGEPIAYHHVSSAKKAYLYKSHVKDNRMLIELYEGGRLYQCMYACESHILGMWQEPVKFDHWDLIAGCIVEIRKFTVSAWLANSDDDLEYDLPLEGSLFPDCPVGTIIKRPD